MYFYTASKRSRYIPFEYSMKNAIVGDPAIDNTGSLSKFRWIDSSIHKAAISEIAWNGCTRIGELKYRVWRSFSRIEV